VWMENTGQYPLDPPLPPCPSGLDRQTMANLQTAVRIAGRKQASYQDRDGYQRLNWFLQGFGRAYVGLTENLHFVPPDVLPHLAFRPLPFASAPVGNIPLFADAIGVNSQVDPSKTGLAIELATLIASQEVTLNAFIGPDPSNPPQYLTPVRNSVMTAMAARWPTYQMIQTTLRTMGGTGFRIGQPSRGWLNANKSCIASQILGPGVEVDEAIFASPGYKSTPAGLWRKP
jgi:thiamine pyridinylase